MCSDTAAQANNAVCEQHSMHEITPTFLCTLGFSVFPLGNGGTPQAKRPRVPSWKPYQAEAPDDEQVEAWCAMWPKTNWAIACGLVSNLVVADCDSPQALAWAEEHLCSTPVRVQTRRGWHLYYQHPGADSLTWLSALRKRLKEEGRGIDLQIDGFYVVAPGSLHEDGTTVYTLHGNLSTFREYAPEFALAHGKGNLADVQAAPVAATFCQIHPGGRHDRMLAHAGGLIRQGLERDSVLADTREQNNIQCVPPLPDREIVSIVDSTFKSEARNHPQEQALTAMDGLRLASLPDAAATAWPEGILHPGGLLEQIMDYTMQSNVRTERIFALAGAVTLLGGILGMRIQSETGLTTNVYCMAIGNSSAGKDAPRKTLARLIYAPGADSTLARLDGGADAASDTAILNYLCREGCQRAIFSLDEIGLFLKSTKSPNSARAGVLKLLTELYSSNGATPYVKRYASSDNDKTLPWRALSILGTSVPGEFWSALCDGEAVNGFLARCLIFEASGALVPPRFDGLHPDPPQELVHRLNTLWAIEGGEHVPEIAANGTVSLRVRPRPHIIAMDAEARKLHAARLAAHYALQTSAENADDMAVATLHGRAGENAVKLALVRFGSDMISPGDLTRPMSPAQLAWGWQVAEECLRRTEEQIRLNIHSSDFEACIQKAIRGIRKFQAEERRKGREVPGAPRWIVERSLRGVPTRIVQEVFLKMARQNILRELPFKPSRGRAATYFCLVEDAAD